MRGAFRAVHCLTKWKCSPALSPLPCRGERESPSVGGTAMRHEACTAFVFVVACAARLDQYLASNSMNLNSAVGLRQRNGKPRMHTDEPGWEGTHRSHP